MGVGSKWMEGGPGELRIGPNRSVAQKTAESCRNCLLSFGASGRNGLGGKLKGMGRGQVVYL